MAVKDVDPVDRGSVNLSGVPVMRMGCCFVVDRLNSGTWVGLLSAVGGCCCSGWLRHGAVFVTVADFLIGQVKPGQQAIVQFLGVGCNGQRRSLVSDETQPTPGFGIQGFEVVKQFGVNTPNNNSVASNVCFTLRPKKNPTASCETVGCIWWWSIAPQMTTLP